MEVRILAQCGSEACHGPAFDSKFIFRGLLIGEVIGMEDDVLVQKRYDQAMSLTVAKGKTQFVGGFAHVRGNGNCELV